MALSKDEIKAAYPLPVYNYKVEIDGETIGFSSVSGINITVETTTYKESPGEGQSGVRTMHMPMQGTPASVTLSKGLVRGTSVALLYGWINSIQLNQVDKKDVFVRLCDETGAAVISWQIPNAFPTTLDAPSFDASSNEVAVETMTLMGDGVFIVDETA